ncbi:MAG: carboxypeptidase regulatory-like domain-containing protein, partial [Planctomycetota bacterium]
MRLPARVAMWASKEAHLPSELVTPKGDAQLVLRLGGAGVAVRGTVVDPDGRAVANAAVAIASLPEGKKAIRPHAMLRTDARGEFATTQAAVGELVVYASAAGFAFASQRTRASAASEAVVEIRLRRPASVHGVVLGDSGAPPARQAMVSTRIPRDLPGLLRGASDEMTRSQTLTDAEGRFRIDGLAPGRTWLMAISGADQRHRSVLLSEGEDREWRVDLSQPSGVIRGVLHGPAGQPLVGWSVAARRVDPIEQKQQLVRAETDANGNFELSRLRPFPHDLTVSSAERGEVVVVRADVRPDRPPMVLRVAGLPSECGSIVGTVLGPDGEPLEDLDLKVTCDGAVRSASSTAAAGEFRVDRVFPGSWTIVGRSKDYGFFDLGHHRVTPGAEVNAGVHRLRALGTAAIRVQATGFEPKDVVIALEQVGGKNKTSAFVAKDGVHRSPPLPPGSYQLLVRGADFAPVMRSVTVPSADEEMVIVEGQKATCVTIEVVPTDIEGSEWQDLVFVTLIDSAGARICAQRLETKGRPMAR